MIESVYEKLLQIDKVIGSFEVRLNFELNKVTSEWVVKSIQESPFIPNQNTNQVMQMEFPSGRDSDLLCPDIMEQPSPTREMPEELSTKMH